MSVDAWQGHPEPTSSEPGRWPLTAPESYVLRFLQDGYGAEAFKLAVGELVARGALELRRVEKRRMPGWTYRRAVLCDGPRKDEVTEAALLPVLELYDATKKRSFVPGGRVAVEGGEAVTGILVDHFAQAAAKEFQPRFIPYRDDCIVPLLVDRGLVEPGAYKGVFSFTKKSLRTPEGRAAHEELYSLVTDGRERLGALLDEDPSQALAYAGTAGAALLLMDHIDELAPDLAFVANAAAAAGDPALALGTLDHLDLSVLGSFDAMGFAIAGGGGGIGGGGGGAGCGGGGGGSC